MNLEELAAFVATEIKKIEKPEDRLSIWPKDVCKYCGDILQPDCFGYYNCYCQNDE